MGEFDDDDPTELDGEAVPEFVEQPTTASHGTADWLAGHEIGYASGYAEGFAKGQQKGALVTDDAWEMALNLALFEAGCDIAELDAMVAKVRRRVRRE